MDTNTITKQNEALNTELQLKKNMLGDQQKIHQQLIC